VEITYFQADNSIFYPKNKGIYHEAHEGHEGKFVGWADFHRKESLGLPILIFKYILDRIPLGTPYGGASELPILPFCCDYIIFIIIY
jgi:hypothetical protein